MRRRTSRLDGAPATPAPAAGAAGNRPFATPAQHCYQLAEVLTANAMALDELRDIGSRLARVLRSGGRLLAAGNGGSSAQAQHLTAELVGRMRDDRMPLSAVALCVETSSLTAIVNDYGADEIFARQVRAHGRPGDVLLLMSTSGSSSNLLTAAEAAREVGVEVWALTGPAPNPLAAAADWVLAVDAPEGMFVQETHLVAVHALCAAVDVALGVTAWQPDEVDLRDRVAVVR